MAGRGRRRNAPKAASPEAEALVLFLRGDVLDAHHVTLRDLEKRLNLSKTALSSRLDGRAVPWEFVEDLVKATVPAHAVEHHLLRARRLWEAADKPAPGGLARLDAAAPPADARDTALERLAADTRDQLTQAFEYNRTLADDLKTTQRMVVLLTLLSAQQHAKLSAPDASPQDLSDARERARQAEEKLEDARKERQAAQAALDQLRQHTYDLEAKIARLTHAAALTPRPEEPFHLPPELEEGAFLGDAVFALRTADDLMARSRQHREALHGDLALRITPLDAARRTAARWSTAALLLGRTLGCTWLILAAIAVTATKDTRPTAATALVGLFSAPLPLAGMLLTSDPWDVIRRLWPIPRALLRHEKIPWPVQVHAAPLTASVARIGTAVLAAVGAGLSTACAQSPHGHWWLLALIPASLATLGYTLAGNDPALRAQAATAAHDLADNLRTPASAPMGAPPRTTRIAVLDNTWLRDRWTELRQQFTAPGQGVPTAVTVTALLWAVVMLSAVTPAVTHAAGRALNGHALAATVDRPVRRYLAAHTEGLPLSGQDVHVLWLAAGLGLLMLSLAGSLAARVSWTAWGCASSAMVWAGSAAPGRQIATAVMVLAWGVASVAALRGVRLRLPVSVTVNNTIVNDSSDDHADQTAARDQ